MSTLTVNGKPPELRIVSRADLLRAIGIPGVRIVAIEHWQPHLVGTVRTPKRGKVIAEIESDGGVLIMYPNGDVVGAADRASAERKIKAWARKVQHPDSVNVAIIEWREP